MREFVISLFSAGAGLKLKYYRAVMDNYVLGRFRIVI